MTKQGRSWTLPLRKSSYFSSCHNTQSYSKLLTTNKMLKMTHIRQIIQCNSSKWSVLKFAQNTFLNKTSAWHKIPSTNNFIPDFFATKNNYSDIILASDMFFLSEKIRTNSFHQLLCKISTQCSDYMIFTPNNIDLIQKVWWMNVHWLWIGLIL